MTATEARKLANEKNTSVSNNQYSKIMEKITLKAKNGEYYMYWYEPFNDDIREKLENEGFVVGETNYSQFDGASTKISW